jgi:hypothetical protein
VIEAAVDGSPKSAPKKVEEGSKRDDLASLMKNKPPPKNSFEFEKDWKQIRGDEEGVYHLMKSIKAEALPKVIQESLSGDKLGIMVKVISQKFAV